MNNQQLVNLATKLVEERYGVHNAYSMFDLFDLAIPLAVAEDMPNDIINDMLTYKNYLKTRLN